jgi:hypothetical protein
MSLTWADVEVDEEEVFARYNQPTTTPKTKPLDYAYKGLLEQRAKLLIPIADVTAHMTEDDLLLNTNLQTSALFNRLTDEFNKKQTTLEEYNTQLVKLKDSLTNVSALMDNLKKTYIVHQTDSVDSLNALNEKIVSFLKETNASVADVIQKKIAKAESEIYDISNKLSGLRAIIVTGVNEIIKEEDKQKKMCSICFDKEVDTALVPCGHTYCKKCAEADRSRYARCAQCRKEITSRIKIFFSV